MGVNTRNAQTLCVLTMILNAAASGSGTMPSPAESHRSQQEPLPRPEGGINLDYMPDELLTGDLL